MTNADTIAQNILTREGDTAGKNLGDGGGTMFAGGQTQVFLDRWHLTPPRDDADAAKNITAWMVLSGLIQIVNVSLPLGDAVCDWAYNSGEAVAIKALQTILGVAVDGLLGSRTLVAVAKIDGAVVAKQVGEARVSFLKQAVAKGEIAPEFEAGLLSRAEIFI